MTPTYVRCFDQMGTVVTIQVVGHGANRRQRRARTLAVERSVAWFREINDRCTRFDPASELRQLTSRIGVPVPVSAMLYEAVRFALAVADESGGAFDPTVGLRMEARGFDREYRTGRTTRTGLEGDEGVSYRDVRLDPDAMTITLIRPLALDLGAVAKGLAIDMAARELHPLRDFAIDAGGDLLLAGRNAAGEAWIVGIRHPRQDGEVIETLQLSDVAVCTSGDYERRSAGGGHHIIDPRTGESPASLASVTVLAPSAMVADSLATAAFVLGPTDGLALLERQGVEGLMFSPMLERFPTVGLRDGRYRAPRGAVARAH